MKPAPLLLHSVAGNKKRKMRRQAAVALYVLVLVAVVVGVDVLFFKHQFWERLRSRRNAAPTFRPCRSLICRAV